MGALAKYHSAEKYVYWLLLFTAAVIPINQVFTLFMIAVTFFAGLAVAVKYRRLPRVPVLPRVQQGLLYLLLAITWYSLRFSADAAVSSYNFGYVVGQYVLLVWLLLRYGGDGRLDFDWCKPKEWPRPLQLLAALLIVGFANGLLGVYQHFTGVVPTDPWVDTAAFPELKTRVVGTLINPNIFAGYLVLLLSFILPFVKITAGKIRGFLLLAAAVLGISLIYTFSRGNWVACACALGFYFLFFWRKWLLPLAVGAAAGVYLMHGAVWHRLISIFGTQDTSVALRFAYLKSTLFIIEEHPFGVGWYGFQYIYPEYDFYLNNPNVIMYHCHNLMLNILAELGWHGLIVFVLMLMVFAWHAYKLARFGVRPWLCAVGQGYMAALVGILAGGLTDHVYFNMDMGLMFWCVSMLMMQCSLLNRLTPHERQKIALHTGMDKLQ
ncbi:MAG: hypothetical protein DBY32_00140 [Phascolarctobacterium sp.]|nr:MAG: hypothetical protein DBY32_00140 [Phascolarctobacterium sp.]